MKHRNIKGKSLWIPENDIDKEIIYTLSVSKIFKFKRHEFDIKTSTLLVFEVLEP
jgi:hypothetical protein